MMDGNNTKPPNANGSQQPENMNEENDNRKPDAERRLAPVSLFGITVGQPATLSENDCFGSTRNVVVLQIHKGGNVIVQDGNVKREVCALNLRPNAPHEPRRTKGVD